MNSPIAELENAIAWHKDQIDRIEKAIAILKNNEQPSPKKLAIKWSKQIDKIFHEYDNLSHDDIMKILINKGIINTITIKNKWIVYTTIRRKCNKNKLIEECGIYRNPNNE